MKVTEVTFERLKSLPNYENERVAVTIELEKGDDPAEAVKAGQDFVHNQLYGKVPEGDSLKKLGVKG